MQHLPLVARLSEYLLLSVVAERLTLALRKPPPKQTISLLGELIWFP